MIDRVLHTIKKYNLIKKGEAVVVGVSGGPDSVCLLHVLHSLRNELDMKLFAVHINHMLRGEEAKADEEYAARLCVELDIPFHGESADIREMSRIRGISLEEAGREARYAIFSAFARQAGAEKIAVAHNKNDQAETMLMRIIRGTGLEGLKGMDYKRGIIIRPLLDIERSAILAYCKKHSLTPRTDSSNLESIYTRNKIRLELIPAINNLFGANVEDNLYRLSSLLKDDNDFIEESAARAYNKCIMYREAGKICLSLAVMSTLHTAIVKRVIRSAVRYLKGDLKGVESLHVEKVVDLGEDGRTGAELYLPSGIRVKKSYDSLIISVYKEGKSFEPFNSVLQIPGTTVIASLGAALEAVVECNVPDSRRCQRASPNSCEQFFDYEKLSLGINIRTRQNGDIFKPFRSNGTKKLKEYFIDEKIPREERDKIPLIAKDSEIVWIIGYKISDKFKVTENTKSILKLNFRNI